MRIEERGNQDSPLATPVVTEFSYNSRTNAEMIRNANALGDYPVFDDTRGGNLTKIVNADGNSSTSTYDEQGRRKSFTDFNGNTTTFNYNTRLRLL